METAALAEEVDMNTSHTASLNIQEESPKPSKQEDHSFYWMILAVYSFPVLLYSWYAVKGSAIDHWQIVVFGLLLACFGTAAMILMMKQREFQLTGKEPVWSGFRNREQIDGAVLNEKVRRLLSTQDPVENEELKRTLAEAQERIQSLHESLIEKDHELEHIREEHSLLSHSSVELDNRIKSNQEQVVKKDNQLTEYQQTILEQKNIIDKKQQYIWKLESKIQDLKYEVETLLQLKDLGAQNLIQEDVQNKRTQHPVLEVFDKENTFEEELEPLFQTMPQSSDKRVQSHYDAAVQLRKCIEVAQKLTGANHFSGGNSRLLNFSPDSYAIDLRRLFDNFRTENSSLIFFYSESEQRLLFVNNHVKSLLGWSPEKFVKDFPTLIQEGIEEWRSALSQLDTRGEAQARLLLKARTGKDILLHCTLGLIPSGTFKGHVIAICHTS